MRCGQHGKQFGGLDCKGLEKSQSFEQFHLGGAVMKQRFGIEIETIAKHSPNTLANKIYRQIDLADKGLQVDTNNHAYHSHIANKWGFENDGSLRPNISYPFGCEIISPPLKIDRLWEVKKILEVLKNKLK